jgi:hypothetical protein
LVRLLANFQLAKTIEKENRGPTSLILLHEVYHTEDKSGAYYSKKLNSAQINYATIDKELLCVIATQHEFCSMLPGAELYVHTDQKILELHYVEGPCNVITGTFSRLCTAT